ncbi:MAG: hypothetical protein H7Y27_14850, partial [Gemmatimonadaceae bacterium]|nr:hypothetical protein [Chitinophagaceae bacterium]
MKQLLQSFFKKNAFFLLGAGWFFTIAFIVDNYWFSSTSARYLRKNIEADIQKQEKDFEALLKNTALMQNLAEQKYSEKELDLLVKKDYGVFLYYLDDFGTIDLQFWNNQLAIPGNDLLLGKEANRMAQLRNGQYEFVRRRLTLANNQKLIAVSLIPVRKEYFIENDNLRREFVNYPQAEKYISITDYSTVYPVRSVTGKVLFYLKPNSVDASDGSNWLTLTLNVIAVLLLLMVVHNVAKYVSDRFGYLHGIFLLIGIIFLLRSLTYFFPHLINVQDFELFDPAIYSSSKVLNSLGDLLINSFLFCWIVLFIRQEAGGKKFFIPVNKILYWTLLLVPILILLATTFVFAGIIKSLISDARISFNVTEFFSLNVYSFVGFIVLAALSLSYFFLSQTIIQLITNFIRVRKYILYIVISVAGLLLLSVVKDYSFVELNIYVLLWLLGYSWFMQQQMYSGWNFRLSISEVLVWLFVFSASISTIIVLANQNIELTLRKRTAEKLSTQSDPSSERLLSIALTYFDNDFLYPNFERFTMQSSNLYLKDSLINKNFSAYISKYDTRIYTFDSSENPRPLYNEDPISYDTLNTIFRIEGRPTNVTDLRYFETSYDKFSYIFRKAVTDTSGKTIGFFFVLSEHKRYKNDALIPELFRPKNDYPPNYTYAVYDRGNLKEYYNEYQFPTRLADSMIPKAEFVQRKQNGYDELWYRDSDKVVVIARKDHYLIEAITLFAYLFSSFLILLALFRVITILIATRLKRQLLRQFFQVNLRSQIHGTFIVITLISFIVIGIATIVFFINRYERNNLERLSKAIQIMNKQVQTEIGRHETFDDLVKLYETGQNEELELMAKRVAEIHGTDINFYDLKGDLVVSSNLFVYNKQILSEKMNPRAFYNLRHKNLVQFINEERIAKVKYQSIYSPVRGDSGVAYAFLNIPSFDSQKELKREISNFLVTIINLNAFIFLIAGAIALVITNRITSSFILIGEKMRDINLGKTNEEIPWNRDDEIGGLVKEYNKMVNKLGDSAAQLAKSEREGAWREMARQVAHEIKNPLTPMKLSIQYLQKA